MSDINSMTSDVATSPESLSKLAFQQRHKQFRRRASAFALPGILIALIIAFSILAPGVFNTTANLSTILNTQSIPAIFAISLMLPLIVGQFDLSLGAVLTLGLIVSTGFPSVYGWPLIPSIVFALLLTTLVGLINGLLVARMGLNSLVVTLAMGSILTGIILWFTGGAVITSGVPEELRLLGEKIYGVPIPFIVLLIVAALVWYFLERTPRGRYFYAVGGSQEAAKLAGLNVRRLTISAFAGAGFLAGIAGVVQAGMLGAGNPTVGAGFLLPGFAAVYLGATTIKPGIFNVPGTLLAVFTVSVGIIGLTMLGLPFFVEPVFAGATLLLAIILSKYFQKK
jgi:ribose transport system permease protein